MRLSYVISRSFVITLSFVITFVGTKKPVYVIGGQSIYKQLLPYCSEALITKVDARMDGADAFFPNLDFEQGWEPKHEGPVQCSGGYLYRFTTYQNIHPQFLCP